MGKVTEAIETSHIRFAPSILRRLGEELNPSVDQGLLELAKNSYDANATECHIWLDGADAPGTVVVEDNGDGMDADAITSGWLVLGDSRKETFQRTRLGRTPAGNKGLGRLAALRLGHRAAMRSVPLEGGEYNVSLDWDEFDHARTVDEVDVDVAFSPSSQHSHGTRIELSQLRRGIGRIDARRLARALVLLADPFQDEPNSFKPVLHSEEYADLAAQVRERYFEQAEYHLEASLASGVAAAKVTDWRGRTLYDSAVDPIQASKKSSIYSAPNARFDLWIFLLDQRAFTGRNVQLSAVKEWLAQFGGVHVYVNDLRVAPYGNTGDDWLGLNLSRVRSPENRPGTNTSIGRLAIADLTGDLVQKTDRTGFIESVAFEELTRFSRDAAEWVARLRQRDSEKRRQQTRQNTALESKASGAALASQIENLPNESARQELTSAFQVYDRAREKEADALRKELQLYRTLSTAGITAATFAHESNGSPLKIISVITNTLKTALALDLPELFKKRYSPQLERVSAAVGQLSVLSSATLNLISEDKRRVGKVYLNDVVKSVVEIFSPFLAGRAVDLDLQLQVGDEPYFRGSEAAVESVVTNLINNSLSAYERTNIHPRRLRIRTRVESDVWELVVDDNGPGIEGIALADIWLPGQTVRVGGTGLGLTIVRDTLNDLGASAEVSAHGDLGGAKFTIRIPILGSDRVRQ